VALVEQDAEGRTPRVVAELGRCVENSHAEHVLNWIEQCLAQAAWPKNSIDLYAATRGPGSFTGIRVALGTVRGLGLAAGRPCIGVTTLEAIAEQRGPADAERMPVMDAGRGELYAARYEAHGSPPREIAAPWVAAAADVLAVAVGAEILSGPGTEVETARDGSETPVVASTGRLAGAAGRLALFRAEGSEMREPLAPLYVRAPDAILKRRQR
jgi:tRNA threonylcarbamoyladenosine biosynthesis protein TsaB